MQIDRLTDPLPSSDEGSFRDRPQAVSDDKSIELSVWTQDIDQPFIKRNASLPRFALGIAKDGFIVLKGDCLLHKDQSSFPVDILPAKPKHLATPHTCIKK